MASHVQQSANRLEQCDLQHSEHEFESRSPVISKVSALNLELYERRSLALRKCTGWTGRGLQGHTGIQGSTTLRLVASALTTALTRAALARAMLVIFVLLDQPPPNNGMRNYERSCLSVVHGVHVTSFDQH
jgi:hypothetical protein